MKKYLFICLCLSLLALALTACGGQEKTANFPAVSGGAQTSAAKAAGETEGGKPAAPSVSPDGGTKPEATTAASADGQNVSADSQTAPAVSTTPVAPAVSTTPAVSSGAWQAAYDKILTVYGAAVKNGFAQYDDTIVSEILAEAVGFSKDLASRAVYAYKDIDGNGTPELVISAYDGYEQAIFDVYAFDGTKAVRLVDDASLGYRVSCFINADGILPLWGSEGAGIGFWCFYRIAADGYTLSLIEQIGSQPGPNWDDDPASVEYYYHNGTGSDTAITRDEYIQIARKYLEWDGEYLSGSLVSMDWKQIADYGSPPVVTTPNSAMFAAYAEILVREQAVMTMPNFSAQNHPEAEKLDIGDGKVEVLDVTGDGSPELIYLTQYEGYAELLHIWTWTDGKAVKVFEQRVRTLAGGGGNYCVYMTKGGELYVYSSENDSSFDYGFWNVSRYILQNGANYKKEPYDFIMNREKASMFCRITEGDVDNAKYFLSGKAASKAEYTAWVKDWSANIDAVIMDSSKSEYTSYEGKIIDAGLYSEGYGPWVLFIARPYSETCMTCDFALTSLRGGD